MTSQCYTTRRWPLAWPSPRSPRRSTLVAPCYFASSSGTGWAGARFQAAHREGRLDRAREARDLERLGDVVVGAERERALQDVLVRSAADHDDLRVRRKGHDRGQRSDPAEPRHV